MTTTLLPRSRPPWVSTWTCWSPVMLMVRVDALGAVERLLRLGHRRWSLPWCWCWAAVFSAARSRSDRGRVEGARRAVRGFRLVRAGGFRAERSGGREFTRADGPGSSDPEPRNAPVPSDCVGSPRRGAPPCFSGAPVSAAEGRSVVRRPPGRRSCPHPAGRHRGDGGWAVLPGGWVGCPVGREERRWRSTPLPPALSGGVDVWRYLLSHVVGGFVGGGVVGGGVVAVGVARPWGRCR